MQQQTTTLKQLAERLHSSIEKTCPAAIGAQSVRPCPTAAGHQLQESAKRKLHPVIKYMVQLCTPEPGSSCDSALTVLACTLLIANVAPQHSACNSAIAHVLRYY
jgi:hypothetical protein